MGQLNQMQTKHRIKTGKFGADVTSNKRIGLAHSAGRFQICDSAGKSPSRGKNVISVIVIAARDDVAGDSTLNTKPTKYQAKCK